MTSPHKNKTFATLLAFVAGGLGMHRFYLSGSKDPWGWLHLSSLLLSGAILRVYPDEPLMFTASPLVISVLAGFVGALVIGLTPDEQWDKRYNFASGKSSHSGGMLATLLVLITGTAAVSLVAVLARTLDLLFTGGSFG